MQSWHKSDGKYRLWSDGICNFLDAGSTFLFFDCAVLPRAVGLWRCCEPRYLLSRNCAATIK